MEERQLTIFDQFEIDERKENEPPKQTIFDETHGKATALQVHSVAQIAQTIDTPDIEPKINGYTPGHPWYYKLGGEIIAVEDIPPKQFGRDKYDPIKRRNGKPHPSLRIQLSNARKSLEEDIARYKKLISEQNSCCSPSDLRSGYDWKFNLSLVYNHVSYDKGLVALLEKITKKVEF